MRARVPSRTQWGSSAGPQSGAIVRVLELFVLYVGAPVLFVVVFLGSVPVSTVHSWPFPSRADAFG